MFDGAGRTIRATCARITLFVVVLVWVCLADMHPAYAAEPPPKGAYHASVVNGDILGSAFMIEDGLVVTNAHVVTGRRVGQKITLIVPSGRRISARIRAVSTQMDLAILSVSDKTLPTVPQTPQHIRRGTQVVAVGIVAHHSNPNRRHMIRGIVASGTRALAPFGRGVIARMPAVQRGFSGGPVFDTRGRLVGMVSALRPARASPSGKREAFILSAADIRTEVKRLMPR